MINPWTARRILVPAFLAILLLSTLPLLTFAQQGAPAGEGVSQVFKVPGIDYLEYTSKALSARQKDGTIKLQWTAPKGRDITFVARKFNSSTLFICLDDGSVYDWFPGLFSFGPQLRSSPGGPTFNKLLGDALYGITLYGPVYVSRDTAATWQSDTAGLGAGFSYDIALDTLQYVYLAYSTGLFKQHPDTNLWHKVTSFPGTTASAVFVDRLNRVFSASFNKLYMSTNGGTTWTIDTTGLNKSSVAGLCDDRYGNVYARNATGLWRSLGGTQAWTRIDQSLSALEYDPSTNVFFNGLSGDSLLYAATAFGAYFSSDQGTTWTRDTSEFNASFIYGLAKTPSGRLLTSTNLGVYYENPGDLRWTKTFPNVGFLAASPVYLDGSGNAYALGAKTSPSNFNSLRANWKSSNGGLTWNPDTAGIGGLAGQNPVYFVDEIGTQHYGSYDTPAKFYRKISGQSWTSDTTGYGIGTSDFPSAFGTDHHGFLYVATTNLVSNKGMIWKRPVGGGTWIPDTAGLAGTQVYWITADKNGVPIAGAVSGVFRKNGSSWTKLPSPPGLSGYSAFVVSVDSSGNTLAGFSTYGFPNYIWRGLYATNNNGSTWTYLGLDSVSIRGLVSYGDTTYAYTYADGLYKVRSTGGASSVSAPTQPTAYRLDQNYPNPFNPTTTIRFSLAQRGQVSLKIFDILGREVATLFSEELEAGLHQATFDASKFASGVYLYRVKAGAFTATKKLVLIK